MAVILCDSVAFIVVLRTRPRGIPLGIITTRKSIPGFPLLSYIAPLGGPSVRWGSSIMRLLNIKTNSAIIWSRIRWLEDGQKRNTSYFLNMEKRQHSTSHISKPTTNDDMEINDPKNILEPGKIKTYAAPCFDFYDFLMTTVINFSLKNSSIV